VLLGLAVVAAEAEKATKRIKRGKLRFARLLEGMRIPRSVGTILLKLIVLLSILRDKIGFWQRTGFFASLAAASRL